MPLVRIVYPGLKPGGHNAIANALEQVRRENVADARVIIENQGGIDAMYRARKPKGGVPLGGKSPLKK